MARRRKQKDDPVQGFVGMLTLGCGVYTYYLTKSVAVAAISAGVIIGLYIGIVIVVNQSRTERLKKSGIAEIDKMDGRRFEIYLSHLFKAHGYNVQVTQAAGDFGADLVISKNGKKIIVQAKRYSKNVGIKAVQEAQAAIAHYGAHEAWVVSNSDYTEAAYSLAKSNGVRLVNREKLIEMILALNPESRQVTNQQSLGTSEATHVNEEVAVSKEDDQECPRCGYLLVRRKGSRGEFLGCSNFPRCRHAQTI
ncbi:restriction endonuclease [Paenibacillus sp. GXUN7292]|uniref:restriction endonuclease n=1 Tax=Paenibacillus sp. GXUN7292 TaxID=3422499 RepID=UPI003D7C8576